MTFKDKFKLWRYNYINGYKIDKLIFNIGVIFMILSFAYIFYGTYGFNLETKLYVACNEAEPCINPFYDTKNPIENSLRGGGLSDKQRALCVYEWCNWEYLPSGFKFGDKYPTEALYNFIIGIIINLIGCFMINHLIYNKGYFKNRKVLDDKSNITGKE